MKDAKENNKRNYEIIQEKIPDEKTERNLEEIKKEHRQFVLEQGAVIRKITRIERTEDIHYLFEDADFSADTIKELIAKGENDTENILASVHTTKR